MKERIDEMIALKGAGCEDVKRRKKKLTELNEYVDCVMEQSCLFIKMYERPDYYFPLDMRDSDNRNWMFALGKDFYERGDWDKVCRIRIDKVRCWRLSMTTNIVLIRIISRGQRAEKP